MYVSHVFHIIQMVDIRYHRKWSPNSRVIWHYVKEYYGFVYEKKMYHM